MSLLQNICFIDFDVFMELSDWFKGFEEGIACLPAGQREAFFRECGRNCVEAESATIMVQRYHSPCGDLLLGSFGGRLCLCDWAEERPRDTVDRRLKKILRADYVEATSDVIREASLQLDEYFAGRRSQFDIPLLFTGTDFQKKVWRRLLEIPYGNTVSYGDLSKSLGCPASVRAVANANGANAISVFIPCHRVIGIDGSLTGYAGGLGAKKVLLDLERRSLYSMNERI